MNLPEDFRYISHLDSLDSSFRCGDVRMDRFSLSQYYRWGRDSHVIVLQEKNSGSGVARLMEYVNPEYLTIGMFAERKGLRGLGRVMNRMVEDIADQLGKPAIRLDSLDTAINVWLRQDYIACDEKFTPRRDPSWGELTPMQKFI